MARLAALTGRRYRLFDYVGHPEAERVVVLMSRRTFEVTSEQQEDITPFLQHIQALVRDAGLVLVSATPVG